MEARKFYYFCKHHAWNKDPPWSFPCDHLNQVTQSDTYLMWPSCLTSFLARVAGICIPSWRREPSLIPSQQRRALTFLPSTFHREVSRFPRILLREASHSDLPWEPRHPKVVVSSLFDYELLGHSPLLKWEPDFCLWYSNLGLERPPISSCPGHCTLTFAILARCNFAPSSPAVISTFLSAWSQGLWLWKEKRRGRE